MTEEESDKAFEVYQQLDACVVAVGRALVEGLTTEQKEYVISRMHDEFRFWRLKELV